MLTFEGEGLRTVSGLCLFLEGMRGGITGPDTTGDGVSNCSADRVSCCKKRGDGSDVF